MVTKNRQKKKTNKFNALESIQLTDPDINLIDGHKKKNACISPCWEVLLKFTTKSEGRFFTCLLLFRVLNACLIQTYFVPDEYWQSTEVAHRAVFGYGYLTWEWREGLRSYLYPFCFSCYFYFLKFTRLDNIFFVVKGPVILQSVLAALADLFIYKTSSKLSSNHKVARWTLLCQLTSWYLLYTSTRTLSNSTECSLVAISLYFFPWSKKNSSHTWLFVLISCLSIHVRPTAAIVYLPLILWQFKLSWERNQQLATFFSWIIIGLMTVTFSCFVDYLIYGKFTNVHLNFFKFNILSGLSNIYGTHPWHWYFTQGFVVVLFSHIVMFAVAVFKKHNPLFIFITLWTLLVYSFLPHKEFRFISGTLPFVMHLCGTTLHHAFETKTPQSTKMISNSSPDHKNVKNLKSSDIANQQPKNDHPVAKLLVFLALILLNFPLALYTGMVHQRGTVEVMSYLSERDSNTRALFLMPCHSTPYYSHIHKPIDMRFLTCEPNLSHKDNYVDEADTFFLDPQTWITNQNWSSSGDGYDNDDDSYIDDDDDDRHSQIPTHIIMFESLYKRLSSDLATYGFKKCAKYFHTHFPADRIDGHVVVVCR